MDKDKLKRIKLIIEDELKFDSGTILEKNRNIPKMYHMYLDIFLAENREYKKLVAQRDSLYAKKYHYFKYDYDYKLDSKGEIDLFIKGDDEYNKLNLKVETQKLHAEFFEKTLDNIRTLSFSIKNHIEFKKFLAGN